MSQRLSTSVTFQNLEDRVTTLESDQILTPSKIIGALGYTPANTAGDTVTYLNAHAFIGSIPGAGGSANLSGSSVPGYTGIVEFRTIEGARNGFIGFNAEAGPMHYGSDTGAGHFFEGGIISPDPAMHFGLRFNSVDGILDFDSGDCLYYSRSSDSFLFNIGGEAKAKIDSQGVMSAAKLAVDGQFYQTIANSTHNPLINFDSNDYLAYDRTGNVYTFNIAGSSACNVAATGLTANGLSAPTISVDANFYSSVITSKPTISFDGGDTLSYDRAANAYAFNVAGAAAASIDATGVATPNKMFPGADPNFYAGIVSSQPRILWDASDSLQYDRTGDALTAYIGGSAQFTINPSSTFVANVLNVGDGNFGLSLNGGDQPLLAFESSTYLSYSRTIHSFAWVIGNAPKMSLDSTGALSSTGPIFPGNDSGFSLRIASGNPMIIFDSGDTIRFERGNNKIVFSIGNVDVGSIDASGNLRIKGILSQGVTP